MEGRPGGIVRESKDAIAPLFSNFNAGKSPEYLVKM